jgi:putative ATP-binding cassette transporter
MLKVRVREWLTHRILGEWLVPGRAYRLGLTSDLGVNPDQRIQEDARQLTELTTQLGTGLLQATLLLVSFVGVLWALSDQVVFSWNGEPLVVPGYMVWCALAYAGIGSILTWIVGRPLIRLNAERFQRESELRFALVRFSENADTIALQRGEGAERLVLDRNLGNVVEAMRRVALGLVRLTWVTSGYGWIALVLPIVVASPGYFGGELSLGGLMMVVGAFNQVQSAMRWFVDSFAAIANWRAAMVRVALLREALHRTDERDAARERLSVEESTDESLSLDGVQVAIPGDGIATCEPSVDIRPGDRVFLSGGSGSGKSTLLKAIAGLWRWGEGRIRRPARSAIMFMPHHPYLPLGTLRAAVAYPGLPDAFADAEVAAALRRVGLARLVPLLDRAERWDRALSGGEQQRLAFARLLLHRPRWVFMDDPAAGLDAGERRRVMSIFDDELAGSAVVSVGSPPDGTAMPRLKTLCLTQTPAPA